MTSELTALRRANIKRQVEWFAGSDVIDLSLSFRGNELAGEVGEACNIIKKRERYRLGLTNGGVVPSVEDLADELADVVICVDLIAMDLRVDLGDAIRTKFNRTSRKMRLSTTLQAEDDPRDKRIAELEAFVGMLARRGKIWEGYEHPVSIDMGLDVLRAAARLMGK